MKNTESIVSKVLEELKNVSGEIIKKGESNYYYARQISNTRIGFMPDVIVYCKNPEDVKYCLKACKKFAYPFRIRSGGHQHEGMCSGNGLMIIDVSQMFDKEIMYVENDEAWIPVGKQLQEVYKELEKRGQTIPGGGCQSVNIGGLTQGGGWGTSIRKFGLTCDNIVAAEVVLSDGRIVIASEKIESNLFWSLKGGGGGNFGVVTRYKFKLSSLTQYTTSFAIRWTVKKDVPEVIKKWINMQLLDFKGDEPLDPNLSFTAGLFLNSAKNKDRPCLAMVSAGLGGFYYGKKEDLLLLLKKHFKMSDGQSLLPLDEKGNPNFDDKSLNRFIRLRQTENKGSIPAITSYDAVPRGVQFLGVTTYEQQLIADFMNPITISSDTLPNLISEKPELIYSDTKDCDRDYHVIPNAPRITCDQPHPHKITSTFPKNDTDHHKLVDIIYDRLSDNKYYPDVSKYMIWHCLGGAVLKNPQDRAFPFADKPYLLQLQCWWDDSGRLNDDVRRNEEYVAWVNDFRKIYMNDHTEGAFINFVDKDIVPNDPNRNELEQKLELLEYYYGKNLQKLRGYKKEYDPENLFNFEMSIPPL